MYDIIQVSVITPISIGIYEVTTFFGVPVAIKPLFVFSIFDLIAEERDGSGVCTCPVCDGMSVFDDDDVLDDEEGSFVTFEDDELSAYEGLAPYRRHLRLNEGAEALRQMGSDYLIPEAQTSTIRELFAECAVDSLEDLARMGIYDVHEDHCACSRCEHEVLNEMDCLN